MYIDANGIIGPLNFENIKSFTLILFVFLGQSLFAQGSSDSADFYFKYLEAGMGSNMGKLMPTLVIRNNQFIYTNEQNSHYGKRTKENEFISSGSFRQSSIDSILVLINGLQDSTIRKTNPCTLSGSITFITVASGTDTTRFTLHNTSDYIVLKLVDIINPYLPNGKKLYMSIEEIRRAEECWEWLRERVDKKSDSLEVKQ